MPVVELEQRMGVRELLEWQAFEEDFGPVTLHERIDGAAQQIAYNVHVAAGGKEQPERFRMSWGTRRFDEVAWLEGLARKWAN